MTSVLRQATLRHAAEGVIASYIHDLAAAAAADGAEPSVAADGATVPRPERGALTLRNGNVMVFPWPDHSTPPLTGPSRRRRSGSFASAGSPG